MLDLCPQGFDQENLLSLESLMSCQGVCIFWVRFNPDACSIKGNSTMNQPLIRKYYYNVMVPGLSDKVKF